MNKETKDRLVTFSVIGLNTLALIIFAMCIFGEHDSSLVAAGLGLVSCSNFILISKNNKKDKEDK